MGNKSKNRSGLSWAELQRREPRRSMHKPPFRLATPAEKDVVGVFWNSSKLGTYRKEK